MGQQVQVHRVEEIEHFRVALVTFLAAAGDSLLLVDLELRRFSDWLRSEQPRKLDRQYTMSLERVAEARAALGRKMIVLPGERRPDIIEEQKAVRQAERRRDEIEAQRESVKKWARLIEPILDDYRGEARQLANLIEGDPAPSLRFINAILADLRAYLEIPLPTPPKEPNPALPSDPPPRAEPSEAHEEKEAPHGID